MASFFSKLFGDNADTPAKADANSSLVWSELHTSEALAALTAASFERPQLIFKHSTSCGISSMVLRKFGLQHADNKNQVSFHLLDLLRNRSLSNEIAQKFEIPHQSPQLLLIAHGKVELHASHYDILQAQISAR